MCEDEAAAASVSNELQPAFVYEDVTAAMCEEETTAVCEYETTAVCEDEIVVVCEEEKPPCLKTKSSHRE
ncbi:hypothetical protein AMTR_s00070p00093550 [Amborella trichopoda]|uniref:Uncharacterized protein n=1 Tax=Amborella trichopoda TaxID=13333 RepID=U5DEG9_AMBTC|nr:hypothetical protein AMTR_s00070p00093550 [Amborella trichopoda]